MKIRRTLLVTAIAGLTTVTAASAQEYKYEIGGTAGISTYMGDANKTKPYLHPGMAAGLVFRHNLNFHWALKTALLAGNISGNTMDSENMFPLGQQSAFHRTFAEAGTQAEFHFLPYSDKYGYAGTKPYTPYLLAGAGFTYASGDKAYRGLNMPVGVGFKAKLKNRLNIAVEYSVRKLFEDDFDVTKKGQEWDLNQPYGIESSLFKNRDWYTITTICLTWDFGLREGPCNDN